ncbi:MAG: P-loop NTPase, partial [Saprospiraceae bacterium]
MNMFLLPQINVPILGVVENMSWFTPEELPDSKYLIFGSGGGEKLAKMSLSELLGKVPLRMSIREGGDSGQPSVMDDQGPDTATFVEIARRTMELVTTRNQNQAPTQIVQVNT